MFRWPVLSAFIGWELIEVAIAMEDGSYWEPQDDGDASWGSAGFEPTGGE